MDRKTARNARALVVPERSAARRARGLITRLVAFTILGLVVYLTVMIVAGKVADVNPASRQESVTRSFKSYITPSGNAVLKVY